MRKAISTILASALLLFGLWWAWEWFTQEVGDRVMKVDFLIALLPAFVGAVWLASDWFDL